MKQIKVKLNIDDTYLRRPEYFLYNKSMSRTERYLIHDNDTFRMLANLSFYRETSVAIVIEVNTFWHVTVAKILSNIHRHSFGYGSQTYVDKFCPSRQAYAKAHITFLWPQLTIVVTLEKYVGVAACKIRTFSKNVKVCKCADFSFQVSIYDNKTAWVMILQYGYSLEN